MKAVIYARVSTTEQVQNLSLTTQLKTCREYCRREGYQVAKEFTDEGESAKTTDRPQFQELLAYCRSHKREVSSVVFYNVSRLSRKSEDFQVIRAYLLGLGITIRSATEPLNEDSVGNLMGSILAAVAQFDNDEKAKRTKAGMRETLEQGRWTFQPPLGYQRVPLVKGELEPDPIRAPLVRLAFSLLDSGRHSLIDVLRRVTTLGLRTRTGKALSPQSFNNLVRNRFYAGQMQVTTWKESFRGNYEPLVQEEAFERVQYRLRGGRLPARRREHDFFLRRFVRCSLCSTPLTGSRSKGRSAVYPYYHCGVVCIRKEKLEALFTSTLMELQPDAKYVRLLNSIVMDVWKRRHHELDEQREMLQRRLRERRVQLERVEEAFLYEQSIDRQTYEQQRDRLRQELALAELEFTDARADHLDIEGLLAFAEHPLTNAATLWMSLDLGQKQELQRVLFPNGLEFDGEKFGTAVTCMAFKKLGGTGGSNSSMASPARTNPLRYWPLTATRYLDLSARL